MNAKVKKHLESGQQVDKVIQVLKLMVLSQSEELKKGDLNISHQFVRKQNTVEHVTPETENIVLAPETAAAESSDPRERLVANLQFC